MRERRMIIASVSYDTHLLTLILDSYVRLGPYFHFLLSENTTYAESVFVCLRSALCQTLFPPSVD